MKQQVGRNTIIILFCLICFSSLIIKAGQLQLLDRRYAEIAQRTTLDKLTLYPSRGLIFDRNKELLVFNNPVYELKAIYNQVPEIDTSLFCSLLEIEEETFVENLNKDWSSRQFSKSTPFVFLSKIDPEVFSRFQEFLHEFPGFYPSIRNIRSYPHQNAAHMLGYMGEVDRKVLEDSIQYHLGDYIGKTGLEKTYEYLLRGKKGYKYVLKDNFGREVASLDQGSLDSFPESGFDLISTLDLELQKYGEELMQGKRGSIVAIEPKTGEILSWISSPNYDPNSLKLGNKRGENFKNLYQDTINKPFLDRAINAKYPPGSIFKPILSLIAFQEGVSKPSDYIPCNGYYQYKTFTYKCHEHTPTSNVKIALQHSCNSYFFDMVRDVVEMEGFDNPEIGLTTLNRYLSNFGLGRPLGIDHWNEGKGFVPTPAFYNKLYDDPHSRWKSTYIMSIGIGQGELELTTIQMANLAAILANKGHYYTPHLVKGFAESNQRIPDRFNVKREVGIDLEHFDPVWEGMRRTVQYGTGYLANVPGISILGKTGTSQNPFGKDHAVFFAFAPAEDPKIAIAVYVENAGFGGDLAAPIAGLMIEKYIKRAISPFMKNKEAIILAKNLL